jgi:hypothetical protein
MGRPFLVVVRLAWLMCVLFDHGTPCGIAGSLTGHEVTTVMERGWDRMFEDELTGPTTNRPDLTHCLETRPVIHEIAEPCRVAPHILAGRC